MKASWGTIAGRTWVDFIFSKDGKVVDLSKVRFPSRGKEEEAVVEGVKMLLANNDSSRNISRVAIIEEEEKVLAVVRIKFIKEVLGVDARIFFGMAPAGAEVIYGDAEARAFSWGVVVAINGKEIALVGKRPKVSVKVEGGKVVVSGDTYPIKEDLKLMKAKWDPQAKAWVLQGDAEKIRRKLVDELGVELSG